MPVMQDSIGAQRGRVRSTAGNYLLFADVWHFRFHTHEGVKNGQPLDVAASNGGAQAVIFVMISQLH